MAWIDTLAEEKREKIENALTARGHEHLKYAGNNRAFAGYLLVADSLAHQHLGMSIFDLPDFCWRDAHEDGMTPGEALLAACEAGL